MFTVKGLKFKYFALLMAAVCIGVGIYLTFFHSAGFIPTKAQIVSITEAPETFSDDSSAYNVIVTYTADGSEYTAVLDSYSPSYKEGKTIDVYYDPGNPSIVHGRNGIGIYVLVVGAALIAFAVATDVKSNKPGKKLKSLHLPAAEYAMRIPLKGQSVKFIF